MVNWNPKYIVEQRGDSRYRLSIRSKVVGNQ